VELRTVLPLRPMMNGAEFFRAYQGAPLFALTIRLANEQVIIEWPLDCANCVLEESATLFGPPESWTPNGAVPQIVSGRHRVTLPVLPNRRFLRLAIPQ
jgi:hypothetical protein